MKKSNVYTRSGDNGTTSLASGQRVPKTHVRLEAYGTLDELSSHMGLLVTYLTEPSDKERVLQIQRDLFSIGAVLATEPEDDSVKSEGTGQNDCCVTTQIIEELERAIDETDEPLGGWKGFILPGGSRGAAVAHVCRTVCRRLERRIYALSEQAEVHPLILKYVNRLSDYLFVLSKKINFLQGIEENIWRKR